MQARGRPIRRTGAAVLAELALGLALAATWLAIALGAACREAQLARLGRRQRMAYLLARGIAAELGLGGHPRPRAERPYLAYHGARRDVLRVGLDAAQRRELEALLVTVAAGPDGPVITVRGPGVRVVHQPHPPQRRPPS